MKQDEPEQADEMRPEYDFSKLQGRVRGKYVERYYADNDSTALDSDVDVTSDRTLWQKED